MRCLVVGCHPDPHSFTLSVSRRTAARLSEDDSRHVDHVDLYREQFDPVLGLTELQQHWSFEPTVQRHIRQLRQSVVVVIVHPLWWAGMPALLSGWIQRVWKNEVAFRYEGEEFTHKMARGLFGAKRFVIVYLSDNPATDSSCQAVERQWKYILDFCAAHTAAFEPIADVRTLGIGQRNSAVTRVCLRAAQVADRAAAEER